MTLSLARIRTRLVTLSLIPLASLGACGPTAPACPEGFTPIGVRCFPSPLPDAGAAPDDADTSREDAAAGGDDAALAMPIDAGFPGDAAVDPGAPDAGTDAGCTAELTYFADADGDGAGAGSPLRGCVMPSGHVAAAGDCDDTSSSRHPGAAEVCNGADDDCDASVDEGVLTRFFADADGDGFGDDAHTREACTVPAGYAAGGDDCDDGAPSTHPGAAEVCNGGDDDCDASVDEGVLVAFYPDCDGDGFAGPSAVPTLGCAEPLPSSACTGGWTTRAPVSRATTDCRIADARAFPGQTMWFSTSTTPRSPEPIVIGYDFDCDGVESRQHTSIAPATCVAGATGFCGQRGWTDGSAPACGVREQLTTCGLVDCARSSTYVTQACR